MTPRYGLRGWKPGDGGNTIRYTRTGDAILEPGENLTDPDGPLIPRGYRGRVWIYATYDGLVDTPCPPLRWDSQSPPTDEFCDFQAHASRVERTAHPERFCGVCGWRRVGKSGGCGPCLSKEPGGMFR